MVAYGAGLRVSEVVALKVSDIASQRMLLRVEQGKGHRDRYAMLSPRLLQVLRTWWRAVRSTDWLFPAGALMRISPRPPCSRPATTPRNAPDCANASPSTVSATMPSSGLCQVNSPAL